MTGDRLWNRWSPVTGAMTIKRFIRGDAAFAIPELYVFLKAEHYGFPAGFTISVFTELSLAILRLDA